MPKWKTVDEYVTAAPRAGQKRTCEMRAILRKAAPNATETLKWGV